jgi:hypothetical protein
MELLLVTILLCACLPLADQGLRLSLSGAQAVLNGTSRPAPGPTQASQEPQDTWDFSPSCL